MQANRWRDTKPEMALRSALHKLGLRFRVHVRPCPEIRARADIVFGRSKVAVFVDGCFWHGCPEHATWPRANASFWRAKIEQNPQRDELVRSEIKKRGWVAVQVWEHEDVELASARISTLVRERSSATARRTEHKA